MNNTEQNTLRVALYIRVSTEEQVERYGIPLQKESLEALIKSRPKLEGGRDSMVLAGKDYVYIDEGVSGTIALDERPAFSRLKEDITMAPEGERPFDLVAVYKIDRFARKLKILLSAIDLFESNGIKFISVNESIDTSTPFGRAMLSIVGVIAELEIETIKDRTRAGQNQAFEAGTVLGSNAPFGYIKDSNKKYKILEPEADVVRQIFGMFVNEDRSSDYIAKYLTSHKVASPEVSALKYEKRKGGTKKKSPIEFWRPDRVRYILKHEIYTGKIYGNKKKSGEDLPKAQWKLSSSLAPMIVDEITFEKAQRKYEGDKHQRRVAEDGHIYLLGGLLKCDCCYNSQVDKNGRMGWHGGRKNTPNGHQYYYACGRKIASRSPQVCRALPLSAPEVENYLVNYTKELLRNPVAVFNHQLALKSQQQTSKHLSKKEGQLIDLIEAIPARKDRLREQHGEGIIDISALKKNISAINLDEERYRTELGEIRSQISASTLSKNYIETLDLFSRKYKPVLEDNFKDRKVLHFIMHQLIEEVVVQTRPVKKSDAIAGRRKENQEIPHRLHIKVKLPQDIFAQIANQESPKQVKNAKGGSGQKSTSGAR